MAFIDRSTRVGRSQGVSIFWGLVSVCFAAAACFYYLKNHDNERIANQMRDQVMQLHEENETLSSQKDHLQASASEAASQLKTREDLVAEKEAELAAEETRLDNLDQQSQSKAPGNLAQVAMVAKFNDVIRKLGKDAPPDVVERGGRPVLRVPNAQLFAPGDTALTADGKALLSQIAQGLGDQVATCELRVVSYTDTDAEGQAGTAKKDDDAKPALAPPPDAKPHLTTSWDLTAARAAVLSRYLRDQTPLPFANIIVIGRGDAEPISSNTGSNHARNQRVEITVAPLPATFRAPEVTPVTGTPTSTPPKDTAKPAPKPTATASTATPTTTTSTATTTAPAKKPADKPADAPPKPKPSSASSRQH